MLLTRKIKQDPSCSRINWKREKGKNAFFLSHITNYHFFVAQWDSESQAYEAPEYNFLSMSQREKMGITKRSPVPLALA